MLRPLDIVVRGSLDASLASSAKRAQGHIKDVGDESDKADAKLEKLGKDTGKNANADKLKREVKGVADEADKAQSRLDRVQSAAVKIGMAGTGALLFATYLSRVAEEGDGVIERLKSILAAQGRLGDFDQIQNLVAEITVKAKLPDDDPVNEAVTQMLSDQVATADLPNLLEAAARNAQALKQPISDVGTLFAKAYAEGNLGRLQRANILFTEQEKASVEAAYGISEAAGRTAFMGVVMASTARSTGALGEGVTKAAEAANAAAREMDNLQTSLGQGVQEGQQSLAGITGHLLQIINLSPAAAQEVGKIGYYASIGATGFAAMLSAGASSFQTLTQIAAYYSTTIGGILSPAFWAARWAAFSAWGVSSWAAIQAAAISAGTSMYAAMLPALAILAQIAAVALIAAAAIYAIDKAMHYKEDQELKANIAAGDATDNERLEMVNKDRAKKNKKAITLEQMKAWESDTSGNMDPEGQQYTEPDPSADLDKLQGKFDKIQGGASPINPASMGGASFPIVTSGAGNAPSAIGAPGLAQTYTGPGSADLVQQIRALEDESANANKARKAVIQQQLRLLRRQLADAKKAESTLGKSQDRAASDAAMLAGIERDNQNAGVEAGLQSQLDKAKEDGNRQAVERLTLEIETKKAQAARENELAQAALEEDAAHRKAMEQAAQLHYQGAIAAAKRTSVEAGKDVDGKGGDRDSRIRAALAVMARGGQIGGGFSALNPSGAGTGNRFSQPTAPSTLQVGDPSYSQDGQGNTTIQFPPLKMAYQGIGGLGNGL